MENLEEAKVILEDAMKILNADPIDIAECKIQYADIMCESKMKNLASIELLDQYNKYVTTEAYAKNEKVPFLERSR